ncbi:hypothetical protein GGTG_13674 [Gaeumannomyces tritici R3-111a-1]|uniref:Uncharacterized protein n=1 Tax=Gaeumannomyces tritici (strain R3-111a-1) TaxID=644352 RepID=J3PJJ0_GAET3|nr:hypothetical protein GGTG_13674 [Gaeumannomyces tritici R3-111a-1]EJT68755.1 hypothetical protein GGTG_13674 [Gaeumannomyces tritici R3-111a-1]
MPLPSAALFDSTHLSRGWDLQKRRNGGGCDSGSRRMAGTAAKRAPLPARTGSVVAG